MRMKQVTALIKTNMLYAHPQTIEQQRKKQAKKDSAAVSPAYQSIIWQNLLILAFFGIMFGLMFSNIELALYPGLFTTFIVMFLAMTMLQGFYMIYNLFYDSKDLIDYLPLPFKASEIFIAKLSVLLFMLLPYFLPVLILFIYLTLSAATPLLIGIPASLLLATLIMSVVFGFSILLVHFVTKLPFFQKHKQMVTTLLYTISTFGMVYILIFFSNNDLTDSTIPGQLLPDSQIIPFFQSFHTIFVDPTNFTAWLGILGWGAVLSALLIAISKWVIPGLFQESNTDATTRTTKRTVKSKINNKNDATEKPKSVKQTFLKYNFGLIQDATLLMQMLSSKLLLPIIAVGPSLVSGIDLAEMPLLFSAVFFFGGFIYTFISMDGMTISAVIISLDRENFEYMRSLPFSMKSYMQQKLLFAYITELALPFVLVIPLVLLTGLPILLAALFLLGLAIGTFGLAHFYFVRDYRLLNLDWQNLTELFNRGGGTTMKVIMLFVTVFVGLLAVFFAGMAMMILEPIWQIILSLALILIPTALVAGLLLRYRQTFWSPFD